MEHDGYSIGNLKCPSARTTLSDRRLFQTYLALTCRTRQILARSRCCSQGWCLRAYRCNTSVVDHNLRVNIIHNPRYQGSVQRYMQH
jgi:hypothetical protein